MLLPRAGASGTLLVMAACAALFSAALVAVEAAPIVFGRDCFGGLRLPSDDSDYSASNEDLTEALKMFLEGHRFSDLKTSDWQVEGLLGSNDVENHTQAQASDESQASDEDETQDETRKRPWSHYFGGFPEYPVYPVYRGSSVGAKAWYRGVAVPDQDGDDDTPTRVTISLLPTEEDEVATRDLVEDLDKYLSQRSATELPELDTTTKAPEVPETTSAELMEELDAIAVKLLQIQFPKIEDNEDIEDARDTEVAEDTEQVAEQEFFKALSELANPESPQDSAIPDLSDDVAVEYLTENDV